MPVVREHHAAASSCLVRSWIDPTIVGKPLPLNSLGTGRSDAVPTGSSLASMIASAWSSWCESITEATSTAAGIGNARASRPPSRVDRSRTSSRSSMPRPSPHGLGRRHRPFFARPLPWPDERSTSSRWRGPQASGRPARGADRQPHGARCVEGHHASGPQRVHLLGGGRQTGSDPSTAHPPDPGGARGRSAATVLLARVQAPRAHRQIAAGASPRTRSGPTARRAGEWIPDHRVPDSRSPPRSARRRRSHSHRSVHQAAMYRLRRQRLRRHLADRDGIRCARRHVLLGGSAKSSTFWPVTSSRRPGSWIST